jgi:putative transcriptional regulator
MDTVKKQPRIASFRDQMRQSLADLQSIIDEKQTPTGDGRFTVRTVEVAPPRVYTPATIRGVRDSLGTSQALFAQIIGVSPSLVRAWELGTRDPSPLARRLLDQVANHPNSFVSLVSPPARAKSISPHRRRRVA